MLSGRGLCDELITRREESYRLWCVVLCNLETSRMGAPYIYDISRLSVNKVITNKRCQFLENIVPINETSEQNPNAYCNAGLYLRWDPTNVSFIFGIMVLFSIMNLC